MYRRRADGANRDGSPAGRADCSYCSSAKATSHVTRGAPMSDEDLRAELERLRKENESLKKGAAKGISMKVSEKGGLSVYGLGRFPITLYKEQWTKLLDLSDEIRQFLATHDAELKAKQ